MNLDAMSTGELKAVSLVLEEILEDRPQGQPINETVLRNILDKARKLYIHQGFKKYDKFPVTTPYLFKQDSSTDMELHIVANEPALHRLQQGAEEARLKGFSKRSCFDHENKFFLCKMHLLPDMSMLTTKTNFDPNLTEYEQETIRQTLQQLEQENTS